MNRARHAFWDAAPTKNPVINPGRGRRLGRLDAGSVSTTSGVMSPRSPILTRPRASGAGQPRAAEGLTL
jgi:hypothetical protein